MKDQIKKPKASFTCSGKLTCPDCGHGIETFVLAGENLPEDMHCPVCNYEFHITWYAGDIPDRFPDAKDGGSLNAL